jgi:ABC-type spermidine/putrescine transport system permease subunit II
MNGRSDWLKAPVAAFGFVAVLFAVQWFFSAFLISPAAETFVFGAQRWNYDSRVGAWANEFWDPAESPVTILGLLIAVFLATISTRLGLWAGNWMTRVQR